MFKKKCRLFATVALLMFSVAGCGNNSDDAVNYVNGTLTLSPSGDNGLPNGSGKVIVSTTASVIPAAANYQVTFLAELTTSGESTQSYSRTIPTNSAGTAGPFNYEFNQTTDTSKTSSLRITATTGGLAATPIYVTNIPAFSP